MSSSELKKLQKVWYDKLKKDGFEDIERDENRLKVYSSYRFGKKRGMIQAGGYESKTEYYRLAGWFLHEHKFKSKVEKLIWQLHSEGKSGQVIAEILKKKKLKNIGRKTVWVIVNELETLMKQKYLEQSQS